MREDLYALNFLWNSWNKLIDNAVKQIADDLLETLIKKYPTTYDNVKERLQSLEYDPEYEPKDNSELEIKVNTIWEIILDNAVSYQENNSEIDNLYKNFKPVYYNNQQWHIYISDITLETILWYYISKHVNTYNEVKKMTINNIFWSKKYYYMEDYINSNNLEQLLEKQNTDDIWKLDCILTYENTKKLFNILKKRKIYPSKYLFNNILSKIVYFIDIDENKMPLSHIKKLFFEPIFKDVIIDERTIQILLNYADDDMIQLSDIKNTLDIVKYGYKKKTKKDGTQYQVAYVWNKITLWELKKELLERYKKSKENYKQY